MMWIYSRLRPRFAPGGRGSFRLRLLDRTVALVLLAILGALRRPRSLTPPLRRIGVMKSTGIGDMILATAVARDIVSTFPDAEVVLFAGADNVALARLVPGVRIVELPAARPWAALPKLRRERLDALLDFGQWSRVEALYAALSGARWTAGFATLGQRRHYAYDATVSHSAAVRELDNFRRLVATLGVQSRSVPRFDPSPSGESPPVTDPYVVFHLWPGGFRSELREWPAESWRALVRRIADAGFSIVLTGGPADAERTAEFARSCGELSARVTPVAGRYGLDALIDVLAHARCVVSVNTGVMHLAAATGIPTVALNGPTSSLRWGPIGPNVACIDSDLPGCGFLNLGFEYDGRRTDCMRGISVDRVADATLERARD
jgi:heptosyltransferase-3